MESDIIKVILPAMDIPLGATVTKFNGSVEFTLSDSILVYGPDKDRKKIQTEDGTRFLIPNGSQTIVSCVNGKKELIWLCDAEMLIDYLEKKLGGGMET